MVVRSPRNHWLTTVRIPVWHLPNLVFLERFSLTLKLFNSVNGELNHGQTREQVEQFLEECCRSSSKTFSNAVESVAASAGQAGRYVSDGFGKHITVRCLGIAGMPWLWELAILTTCDRKGYSDRGFYIRSVRYDPIELELAE